MAVNIGDVIRTADHETSELELFEYMWRRDQEALGTLQYKYLLAFEESVRSNIYHNPETKRTVNVPASGLSFAVRLNSGSSYCFALENDQPLTRWYMVVSRLVSVYYLARITPDNLIWTWFSFLNQITDVPLEMYSYDATIISPLSIATDPVSTSTVQGRSFDTAYETNSTLTRTLPNIIDEMVDYLLHRWYIAIASAKQELMKELEKETAAFDSLRIQTGQVVGKLSEAVIGYVRTGVERTSQITKDFSQALSEEHLKATLEEIRQTEQYNLITRC